MKSRQIASARSACTSRRRIESATADGLHGRRLQQQGFAALERSETETRQLEGAILRAQSVLEKLENGQMVNDEELVRMPIDDEDFPF